MYKVALSSLFAVFLFALGAVGAWYFQQQTAAPAESSSPLAVSDIGDRPVPESSSTPDTVDQPEPEMPIPVHAKSMSAEELFRYGAMNRASLETLRQREELVRKEELRLHLVQKDIEGQKREVEGILTQTQQTLEAAEQLVAQIQQQRQTLAAEQQQRQQELEEIRRVKEVPDVDKQANIKKMAELLGSMSESDAAQVLKSLVDKGSTDYVLQLLDNIEQRDAAKILDALESPELVADLTEKYRELKRFAKKNNRRQ